MPIIYRIDHERKVVLTRGYLSFTDEDVFTYQKTVWSRPVDMAYVTEIALPSIHRVRDLATTAASMDHPSGSSRMAIAASDDFAFGLGRMFEMYKGLDPRMTKEVGVFRTTSEAFAFLGMPPLPLPEVPESARGLSEA